MSNLNDIFEMYPDYDVFDDKKSEIGKKSKAYKNDEFIEYDEKRDFRNKKQTVRVSVKNRDNVQRVPRENYEEEPEHSTDYRDDYGVYRVYEDKVRNYATIFFFPVVMVWLESVLRFACGESLMSFSMVFVVLFSLSFSAVLTTVCTLFGERFNRVLVNIIVVGLSVWYCVQIVNFNLSGTFLLFSQYIPAEQTLDGFQAVMDTMSDKVYYLLACFAPSVLNLFLGKFIFPFRRTPVPAKVCLLLAAVLLYFSAVIVINFDRSSPAGNYATYYQSESLNEVQEKFGLLTMQVKDIFY